MSDDEQSRWVKELLETQPLVSSVFDDTLTVLALTTGEIVLDCPNLQLSGKDHARSTRVLLTPEAARILRLALAQLERSPDEHAVMRKGRPTH